MMRYLCEFLGTTLLLAVVTGSGIIGESLGQGNAAVALLGNSIATGAALYVLINLLGPLSGAHFNPAVSAMFWKLGHLKTSELYIYWACQLLGAIAGVLITHILFDLEIIQKSSKARDDFGIWTSEFMSTLILLGVIYIGDKLVKEKVAMLVALTVTAGYWFTSSTFFANPAVTIARSFTDTFVGISPEDVMGFIAAQILAVVFVGLILEAGKRVDQSKP